VENYSQKRLTFCYGIVVFLAINSLEKKYHLTRQINEIRLVYMTDQDRNTRTLIVSFMVALMVMVPLRFIEATKTTLEEANRVLGETTVKQPVKRVVSEKPVVSVSTELEAPYNVIDEAPKKDCLSTETATKMIETIIKTSGKIEEMNESDSYVLFEKIKKVEERVCN